MPPYLSVVIVFHSRLNFLPLALESVLGQTLPASGYEILVVGPQRPVNLIERAQDPRVRFVACAEVGLGSKVGAGIREAQGEVVSFLEDDDLYEPDKLASVEAAFRSDPALSYFQNGFRSIDEAGTWLARPGPDDRAMERWSQRGVITLSSPPRSGDLRQLVRIPAGFNNSSISVRRSSVERFLKVVESVDMLVDVTLLYGALVGSGHLRLDPRPLTRLRKHAASNSDPRLIGEDDQLSRLTSFSQKSQDRRELLLSFVRAHGAPAVVRAMEGQWAMGVLFLRLRDNRFGFLARAQALMRSLERMETFEVQNYRMALPLGFLVMLAGKSGPRLYIRVRRRFYLQSS